MLGDKPLSSQITVNLASERFNNHANSDVNREGLYVHSDSIAIFDPSSDM